jgi:hypothetical protein
VARIKGANLIDVVRGLRKLGETARKVVPAHLAHYLDDRILISSWYPELEVLELMRIYVGLTSPGSVEAWEFLGRLAAHMQMRDTYRHILESREPVRIVKHANVIWQSHHDTGEVTVELDSEPVAYLTLRGHQALCSEWCSIMAGYCAGMVEAAGARNPRCRLASCDFKVKMARWKLAWEPPLTP